MDCLLAVGAEAKVACYQGAILFGSVEDDPLTLAQHPEERTFEGPGTKQDIATITIAEDDTDAGLGIVYLYNTLHDQAFSTFPALMHDVQTRMRLLLLP